MARTFRDRSKKRRGRRSLRGNRVARWAFALPRRIVYTAFWQKIGDVEYEVEAVEVLGITSLRYTGNLRYPSRLTG